MRKYSVLLIVLGSILWGTDSLFRRPLSRDLSPITIVTLEHLILSLVVLPFLARTRCEILALTARDWSALLFIALGGSVAATSLFTFSIKYGNPSVTVLLQKTQPAFAILLARWLLHERPGRWFWRCLLPAILGAYLVSAPDWRRGFLIDPRQPLSILAALSASLLWGSCTVLGRYIVARLPVLALTGLRFVVALPVLALLFWLQTPSQKALPANSSSLELLAGMALVPGLAALLCYYFGLRSTIASVASVGELAFPLTAVAANWFLLDVRLAPSQLAGGAILVSCMTFLTYLDSREKDARQSPSLALS